LYKNLDKKVQFTKKRKKPYEKAYM